MSITEKIEVLKTNEHSFDTELIVEPNVHPNKEQRNRKNKYVVLVDEAFIRGTEVYKPDNWDEDWEAHGNFKEQEWYDADRPLFLGIFEANSEEEALRAASERENYCYHTLYTIKV